MQYQKVTLLLKEENKMQASEVLACASNIAKDIGLVISMSRTYVRVEGEECDLFICLSMPSTSTLEEMKLARAAYHSCIFDSEVKTAFPRLNAFVTAASPIGSITPFSGDGLTASSWVQSQKAGLDKWVKEGAELMLRGGLCRVISDYSWRNGECMVKSVPTIVALGMKEVEKEGVLKDSTLTSCMELLLPPIDAALPTEVDKNVVMREFIVHIGGPPKNTLDLYEVVYLIVRNGVPSSPNMKKVYDALFK